MGDIADDMVEGFSCSHCGIYFEVAHGYPVLCENCYGSETEKDRAGLQKATNHEV